MAVAVYSLSGRKTGSLNLDPQIFGAKVNPTLMAQAVRVFLSNQRQGTKKVKTRGEVRGSTRKIYRQKGTGRARHGDIRAPIFVGGGKAHGPTGKENYALKLPKAMRQLALVSALTETVKNNAAVVIDKLEAIKPKTKNMAQLLKVTLGKTERAEAKKVTLVVPEVTGTLRRASANLRQVKLITALKLNTYEVLDSDALIIAKSSLPILTQRLASQKITKPIHNQMTQKEIN